MKFEHYGTFKQATNIRRSAVDSTELATTVDVVSVVNSRRRSPTIDHVQLSVYSMMVVRQRRADLSASAADTLFFASDVQNGWDSVNTSKSDAGVATKTINS